MTQPAECINALVVEDDVLIRLDVADTLRRAGWQVYEASEASEAFEVIDSKVHLDVVVTDVRMPGTLDGLDVARRCRQVRPGCVVVVASAHFVEDSSARAAYDAFFRKPFDLGELISQIASLAGADKARIGTADAG